MNLKIKRIFNWSLPFLWMGIIFWFSNQSDLPHASDTLLDFLIKKGAHIGEYAVLCYLWMRNLKKPELAIGFALLFAVSDEWHQSFTPSRHPQFSDVMIDAFGIYGAYFIYLTATYRKK